MFPFRISSFMSFLRTKEGLGVLAGVSLAAYLLHRRRRRCERRTERRAVVITGCDSGLGYSFALHASSLGLTVFAGCLDPASPTLAFLRAVSEEAGRVTLLRLDITDPASVTAALSHVEHRLAHENIELLAVVNNAGVMIFAEFDWLTEEQIARHVNVNLLGTMLFTRETLPLLRKHQGRLITVLSHCAFEGLPGLSAYCATKAGLNAWSDSLRVEMAKFNVKVVKIIPGGFVSSSRLLAGQKSAGETMWREMSEEGREVYDGYFQRYMSYLARIPVPTYPMKVEDAGLYQDLEDALFSGEPRESYVRSPLRYALYHSLFRLVPVSARDFLALQFMSMPPWRPSSLPPPPSTTTKTQNPRAPVSTKT